jgi:hypothetical protein
MDELGLGDQLRNAVHDVLVQKDQREKARQNRNDRGAALSPTTVAADAILGVEGRARGSGRGGDGVGGRLAAGHHLGGRDHATGSPAPRARRSAELDAVVLAKKHWEEGICDELNTMAAERERPLARQRSLPGGGGGSGSGSGGGGSGGGSAAASSSSSSDAAPWWNPTADGGGEGKQQPARFLFDSEDFLESIMSIPSSNHRLGGNTHGDGGGSGGGEGGNGAAHGTGGDGEARLWGLVKLQLATPDAGTLRDMFKELEPSNPQLGVDDVMPATGELFMEERIANADRVIASGSRMMAQSLVRTGSPNSSRKEVWCKVMSVRSTEKAALYLDSLLRHYRQYDLLIDELLQLDVQNTVNDDTFFPFEDVLGQVVCAFSRDPWVLKQCVVRPHADMTGVTTDGEGVGAIPPCGLQVRSGGRRGERKGVGGGVVGG